MELIEEAKAEYTRAQDRVMKALSATPDDKINWSPSPTARTPVQLAAHAGHGTELIMGMIQGKPFGYAGFQEMDIANRLAEQQITQKEKAVSILQDSGKAYLSFLDGLTREQTDSTVEFPFGAMPMRVAITLPADHLRSHASQMEYIQTIYGDTELR